MAMAVATAKPERDVVYPEDRLPWPQTILMGLQHVMAMFGATVLVPLILGFNPNTVIFFSGVATLIFLVVTGFKVPSYLGSSFSFIGSVLAVQGTSHNHGLAYAGIVMAGVIYLIIGVVVHFVGVNPIRYLLPPVVTGTVVAVIGLALASAATGNYAGEPFTATVTLLAAVGAAVYLRGFPRLLPVLIGIVVGYLVSIVYPPCSAAASACHIDFSTIGKASLVGVPAFSFPDFSQFGTELSLFFFIAVIGGKIWVDARVDFSKRANLAVAAIPLVIAAGIPATQAIPIHLGGLTLTFNNLGLGALSAIVLYQLLRPGHVRDAESEPAEVVATK